MSKVFSFRLDENNPREARALAVIQEQVSRGYSLRRVVTEAILTLTISSDQKEDLFAKLDLILGIIQEDQIRIVEKADRGTTPEISLELLDSIKTAVKPGKRFDAEQPVS